MTDDEIKITALEDMLEEVQFSSLGFCPICSTHWPHERGKHYTSCKLAALLPKEKEDAKN